MLLDAVHITNKFAQHGDTLITSVTNMPEQMDVRVTDFPESINLAKDVAALRDSVCQALSDSIHHLDSIVNHISTYGTDMPTEIKSFVIPLLIAVFTIAFPLIFNAHLRLREKYSSHDIGDLLEGSLEYKLFIRISIITFSAFVIYCIFSSTVPTWHKYLYNHYVTAAILFLVWASLLAAIYVYFQLRLLFDYRVVYKWALEKYNPAVFEVTSIRNKNVAFSAWVQEALLMCLDKNDLTTYKQVMQILITKLDAFIEENKTKFSGQSLIFADAYYNAIEKIIRQTMSQDYPHIIQKEIDKIPANLLFKHHNDCMISIDTILCYFTMLQIARTNKKLPFIDQFYLEIETYLKTLPFEYEKQTPMQQSNMVRLKDLFFVEGAYLFSDNIKTVYGYSSKIKLVEGEQHIFPVNKEEWILLLVCALAQSKSWDYRHGYGERMQLDDFINARGKLLKYAAFLYLEDTQSEVPIIYKDASKFNFEPYLSTVLVPSIGFKEQDVDQTIIDLRKEIVDLCEKLKYDRIKDEVQMADAYFGNLKRELIDIVRRKNPSGSALFRESLPYASMIGHFLNNNA